MPDEATLAAVIKSAGGDKLTAYVDTVSAQAAARAAAEAGHDREDGGPSRSAGITEWTLSNGVRVVLKPTTFKQDEILFRAFSPGGTSLADDQDFVAAETADQVVAQGGLGTLERIDLEQEARGQERVRARRTSTRCPRALERPRAAPRSRDDVPVDLSDVHAAARRPGGVPAR